MNELKGGSCNYIGVRSRIILCGSVNSGTQVEIKRIILKIRIKFSHRVKLIKLVFTQNCCVSTIVFIIEKKRTYGYITHGYII